jgi:hypothetical protein
MGKVWIELPYQGDAEDLQKFFEALEITHFRKDHKESDEIRYIKVGDGVRFKNGLVARVMEYKCNEVGEPHILVANKNTTDNRLYKLVYETALIDNLLVKDDSEEEYHDGVYEDELDRINMERAGI